MATAAQGRLPLIPPRLARVRPRVAIYNYNAEADWYFVKSPRDDRGAVGPVSLDDIKELYQETEINDRTLYVPDTQSLCRKQQ